MLDLRSFASGYRSLLIATASALAGLAIASASVVLAQGAPPPQVYPPAGQPSANPVCQRLEAQLVTIDRGGMDPAKADQIRRYEDSAAKQEAELERVTAQAKRMGCDSSGFFSLFNQNSAQCGPVNAQIQKMRGNLDQINTGLSQLRGPANLDRDNQRRSVLTALAQNNCGPQYVNAAPQGGGFFGNLFGGGNAVNSPPTDMGPPSSTFRTVCVRTCDGFYFPVSYATVPSRFAEDEKACKQLCPAAEATLFTFRNPGEDINQAVSISGQPYSSLPNAFRYRQEYSAACSCKAAGQSWADALKTIDERSAAAENGDIIVTDESAKKMAQPPGAQGKGAKQAGKGPASPAQGTPVVAPAAPPAGTAAAAPAAPAKDGSDKPIRTVGPQFIPQQR